MKNEKIEQAKKQLLELADNELSKLIEKGIINDRIDWTKEMPQNYAYSTTNVDWLGICYEYPLMSCGGPLCFFKYWEVKCYGSNIRFMSISRDSALDAVKRCKAKGFDNPFNVVISENWIYSSWDQLEENLECFKDLLPDKFIIKKTKRLKVKPPIHFEKTDTE